MRIAEICTRHVIHIAADASMREAAATMRARHVGALVVVEPRGGERVPIGMLTDRDIVVSIDAAGVGLDQLRVGDAMSRDLATCGEGDDVFGAIETMRARGVRRLPVLNAAGGLAGIVAADDVVGAIAAHLRELSRALVREQAREMDARR